MQPRAFALLIACAILPQALAAQGTATTSANPDADALRGIEQRYSRIFIAAAEAMPPGNHTYLPTPAQMSLAQIQSHLSNQANDLLCSKAAGVPAPHDA